jgi:hypothetical protein
MANEKIVFDTEVKVGGSVGSIKSLKSELKDLRNQLGTLEQGSEAFNKAATRAGQLQDKIRGVNDAIENADPEKKFAPFARTVQGLAGGFAAAQGAMALFGSESEDLQKTLVKVQGAMALSQGLNSLLEFKNDFKDLGGMIINNVVKAFTTLRGAIIATGIGALAVTVGILITNWKEFSKAITDAFPAFKAVTDFFSNLKQVAAGTLEGIVQGFKVLGTVVTKIFQGDFSGAIDAAKTLGEKVATAYNEGYAEEDRKIKIENGLKDRKFALDLEEAKGKDVKAKRVKLMQDELSLLEKGSEEYNAKLIEIEKVRTDIRTQAKEKKDKEDEEAKKKREASDKDNLERAKEYDEKEKKRIDDTRARNNSVLEAERERRASHINDLNDIAKDETLIAQERFAALDELNKKGLLSDKQTSDAKIAIAQKEAEAKKQLLQTTAQILGGLSDLAGKQTEEGKVLAIAQATIDTYLSASAAYTAALATGPAGLILAPLAAGAAILAGIARVKAISDVQVPNGGGGGGGGNITAPSAPRIPQSVNGTMLNQNKPLDINNTNPVGKVIVTETDITATQDKVKGIIRKATIK